MCDDFDVAATEDELFSARPYLKAIQSAAYARMCAPRAVLGAVIARALVKVPPSVVLPAIVGGPATLNLIVVTAAPSGGSKTSADKVTAELVPLSWETPIRGLGSGEGLITTFREKAPLDFAQARAKGNGVSEDDLPQHIPAALFVVDELAEMSAVSGRSGATLMPRLRSLFSGQTLGAAYAGEGKGYHLPANSYRACVTIGAQPGMCGPLFTEAARAAGTPQRLLWTWAVDERIAEMPDDEFDTAGIEALELPEAALDEAVALWERQTTQTISVPGEVVTIIRNEQRARHRGDWSGDPLDAHGRLIQLKVAAALAVLDGRVLTITAEDWYLAWLVMECHRHWRERVIADLSTAELREQQREGAKRGGIALASDEEKFLRTTATVDRVADLILRKLPTDGAELTRKDVRSVIASRDRAYLDSALGELVNREEIVIDPVTRRIRRRTPEADS